MSMLSKKFNFNEVFDSQKLFRVILTAMSNPFRTINIKAFGDKLFGDNADILAVAMTLLDNEVSFCTCENRQLSEEIISLTLSNRDTVENADLIFVTNPDDLPKTIANVKCGTLVDPHKSATIVIKIPADKNTNLLMTGPGIDGKLTVSTSEVVEDVVQMRDNRFFEYPEGIDLIFIDDDYNLFAVPRLVQREVV